MKIGGLQKLSLIDYPEHLAAIVFTQGCPWRCSYCHNPSLVIPECFAAPMPEEEVFKFLESRRGQLDGVVITGGEPTLQPDLPEFVRKIHDLRLDVKLDTSGVYPDRLEKIVKVVDYIAMDLKADWKNYETVVGEPVNIDDLKRSMELIRASGKPYEFRTTVVPQLPIDVAAIAKNLKKGERYFLQAFRAVETVPDKTLTVGVDPFKRGEILKKLEPLGLEVAWR